MEYEEFLKLEKLINTVRGFKKIKRESSASISHKKRDEIFDNIVAKLKKNKRD